MLIDHDKAISQPAEKCISKSTLDGFEGSLGRTAQDGHLDSHTAPELWLREAQNEDMIIMK